MKNEFEDMLDQIRIELYEKTKDMSNGDIIATTNTNARRIAKQYGITLIKKEPIIPKQNSTAI